MKVGRNEPCPCGSGKKFKKCCQPKEEEARAEKAAEEERDALAAAASANDKASAVATSRASRRPGDRVPEMATTGLGLTPYVVAQIAEDPGLREDPQTRAIYEDHLRDHWTIAKVAAMTTEDIEERLRTYGVAHTRERFLELAREYDYAWSISCDWEHDPITCQGKEVDFLGLAACELWKRLSPERPSVEMIDDWMQAGYRLDAEGRGVEACDLWWKVWCTLRPRFSPVMKTMEATDQIFSGRQSVFNWTQDFETSLHNVAAREPRFASVGLEYCREWLAQFTDEGSSCQVNFRRAKAHFHFCRGEIAEGEAALLEIVERWPKDPWGHVALADAYSHSFESDPGPPRDDARAIAYLEQGLAIRGLGRSDRETLVERLEEVRRGVAGGQADGSRV
jgi:hypothetical protein